MTPEEGTWPRDVKRLAQDHTAHPWERLGPGCWTSSDPGLDRTQPGRLSGVGFLCPQDTEPTILHGGLRHGPRVADDWALASESRSKS